MLPCENDFIYCDPPYWGSEVTYTQNKENLFSDNERLCKYMKHWASTGVYVMASGPDTPELRELYDDSGFNIHILNAKRSIRGDLGKNKSVNEILVTSY